MKKFAIIGHPVAQSKSPCIQEAGFAEFNLDASFEAIDVKAEDLDSWMKTESAQFEGICITSPYKENIRKFLDQETPAAKEIGAVNTIFRKDNLLIGTNTDGIGVFQSIAPIANPKGKICLVLGAGGASRAIIFALKSAGADIVIFNRTFEKAEKLAKEFGVVALKSLEKVDPDRVDIILNATTVGMGEWRSVLPEDFWREKHVAFDAIYHPLETKFLHDASEAGATTITGDQMLVHQAVEQFRLWHDIEIDPEVMFSAFFE